MTRRDGWTWLPCGCVVCYQGPDRPGGNAGLCDEARALEERLARLMNSYGDDDIAGRRPAWVAVMRHYGVEEAALDRRWPRYGWTPSGRPIHTTSDPDYGRKRCECGFVWDGQHAGGCPPHLAPNPDSPRQRWLRRNRLRLLP